MRPFVGWEIKISWKEDGFDYDAIKIISLPDNAYMAKHYHDSYEKEFADTIKKIKSIVKKYGSTLSTVMIDFYKINNNYRSEDLIRMIVSEGKGEFREWKGYCEGYVPVQENLGLKEITNVIKDTLDEIKRKAQQICWEIATQQVKEVV